MALRSKKIIEKPKNKKELLKPKDKKDVMELVKKHDVKFVRLWFSDIHGQLKSFAVPVDELAFAFDEGMGFDGSSIKGFARIDESDMIARPDPTTFAILPWRPKEKAVARMFCDIYEPDGSPYKGDPRYVLKMNLEKAKKKGFTFYLGPVRYTKMSLRERSDKAISVTQNEIPRPPRRTLNDNCSLWLYQEKV
jgi:hypothetical protein